MATVLPTTPILPIANTILTNTTNSIPQLFQYNMSLFNTTNDKNTFVIALNNSSNVMVFSFFVLLLFIVYIIIMYLCSFILIPIDTITSESHMFSSLIFNPNSANTIFHQFIQSNLDGFSNISDNTTVMGISISGIIKTINIKLKDMMHFINYWFHRGLLYFYIQNGTISSIQRA